MKLTHIRHLAAIAVAAQLAMSASAAPIDNYTDLADAVATFRRLDGRQHPR